MTIAPPLLAKATPRSNGTAPPKPKNRLSRVDIATVDPDRIVVNAVEGWGKTTLGAYAPNPAILMSRGETGYPTLLSKRLVPDRDCIELKTWQETMEQVEAMIAENTGHESLVLDALGGFERLCHEHVCAKEFGNNWGESGFQAFMRGYDVAVSTWLLLLQNLDRLRSTRKVRIILLSHAKARTFKNPMGTDFDRYVADCHEKTWAATAKWADAILFGTFRTVVEEKKNKRAKGIGGDERVIFTQRRDAYDAKNRHGLPSEITLPTDPAAMWSTLAEAIATGPGAVEPAPVEDDAPPA